MVSTFDLLIISVRTGEEDEDAEEPDDDIDGEGNNKDGAGDASKADETEPTGGDFSGETGEEEKDVCLFCYSMKVFCIFRKAVFELFELFCSKNNEKT